MKKLKGFHYEAMTDRWNRVRQIETDGNGVYLTVDSDQLIDMGFETFYGIGNQQTSYYSNDKELILSLVGKCGRTESKPACFTASIMTLSNGHKYAKFDHYIN